MAHGDFWDTVRTSVIGAHAVTRTCFGPRRVVYADYTASGRAVGLIEDYLRRVLEEYGNTHTEDDATGRSTTARLEAAERIIKRALNAGDEYALIPVGAGTTGAVERLQQILGVYMAPATRDRRHRDEVSLLGATGAAELEERRAALRPVVFVGPYEHHSNELSWRESDAVVVPVRLDVQGLLDLQDLERQVSHPRWSGRRRIGAFSACSNVTGLLSPVYDVARTLHRHGALAVFDLAAVAPYRPIDVCRDAECYFDAAYFSPHKLVGGPGSAGILVVRREHYRADLPPTFAGGGTVEFVNDTTQDYVADIEAREMAGTPAVLQTLRAALALELKERMGLEAIEEREKVLTRRALERLSRVPGLEVVGNPDPGRRIGIVSFTVAAGDAFIHPRLVTRLLNDLFGIQSRAGCLCAGPYGHRLLGIDPVRSEAFRAAIHGGRSGLKPGWTRLSFHYLHTDEEIEFLCDAVELIAAEAPVFLPLYVFDTATGAWSRRGGGEPPPAETFGISEALGRRTGRPDDAPGLDRCLEEARSIAHTLRGSYDPGQVRVTDRTLVPFAYVHATATPR